MLIIKLLAYCCIRAYLRIFRTEPPMSLFYRWAHTKQLPSSNLILSHHISGPEVSQPGPTRPFPYPHRQGRQGRLHPSHDPTLQTWRLEIPRKRTCEYPRSLDSTSNADQESKPVARPCVRRFTLIHIHTSHFSKNADITLQDVPNREYTLRLFVENVERELQKKDDHTWTPVQRQCVPYFPNTYVHTHSLTGGRDICPTSQIRTEVQMKKKFSARHWEARQAIGLDGPFSDYWSSNNNEFTVLSQSLSPTGPCRSD